MLSFNEILEDAVETGASDIHISVGACPAKRIDGKLIRLPEAGVISREAMDCIICAMLNEEQREVFNRGREFDLSTGFSWAITDGHRFRSNFSFSMGSPVLSMRIISPEIRSITELLLPDGVREAAKGCSGLFLVTGPAGSGKSTTLAAIINEINISRHVHIVTVEDPIEYVHTSAGSLIHQREVGDDTRSFAEALRRVIRQDPDVIMIGEMRDLETITAAVTAAETGHFVLATMHTRDAAQSMDRIIDVFPPHQQPQIRTQLSSILTGIISQRLLPLASGKGRAAATEYMVVNNSVRNHIREAKTAQIKNTIQTGAALGMHSMEQDIARMCKEGLITRRTAISYASNPEDLERYLGK